MVVPERVNFGQFINRGAEVWSDKPYVFRANSQQVKGGGVMSEQVPDETLMCSCELHPIRFEGDICENCAWDIHSQLDGLSDT